MKSTLRLTVQFFALLLLSNSAFAQVQDFCGDGDGAAGDFGNYILPDEPAIFGSVFDEDGDVILEVELVVCSAAQEKKTKYQVHLDHTAPFASEGACENEQDDTLTWRPKKVTGPGDFIFDDSLVELDIGLYYASFNLSELNPGLGAGDTVQFWAQAKNKGLLDRVPDTDGSDGCGDPQTESEVVTVRIPCFETAIVKINDPSGDELDALEAVFTPQIMAPLTGDILPVGLACDDSPPIAAATSPTDIALIERGLCAFDTKIANAKEAGYQAAVVYNSFGDDLITMAGTSDGDEIPALFVGNTDGLLLQSLVAANVTLISGCASN